MPRLRALTRSKAYRFQAHAMGPLSILAIDLLFFVEAVKQSKADRAGQP